MTTTGRPVREGFHTATPYLIVRDAAGAIEFYKKALGATELLRVPAPKDHRLMHAEIKIGDAPLMLADEYPEIGARSPKAFGGSPVSFMLYVEDADTLVNQAVAAGAKLVRPVQDQEYGRVGGVEDPFGYTWYICRPTSLKTRTDP
jgi:PhnB protein